MSHTWGGLDGVVFLTQIDADLRRFFGLGIWGGGGLGGVGLRGLRRMDCVTTHGSATHGYMRWIWVLNGVGLGFAAEFSFEFGVGDLDHGGAAVGAAVGEVAF